MLNVGNFYDAIDSFAPFDTAMSWDNVGILIGSRRLPVNRALLALDLTGTVLEEAVRLKVSLIITHHPVIFKPMAALDAGSIVYRAVAAGVSVISAHTNLDLADGGVNDALAQRIQLQNIRPFKTQQTKPCHKVVVFVPTGAAQEVFEAMAQAGAGRLGNYSHCAFLGRGEGRFMGLESSTPAVGQQGQVESVEEVCLEMICEPPCLSTVLDAMRKAHPYEEPAFDVLNNHAVDYSLSLGRIGDLAQPVKAADLAAQVKLRLGAAGLRYVSGGREITTVAVCGGAGSDMLADARRMGAQALVTADAKHHELLEAADTGITLIDAGHFATENTVMEPLRYKLSQLLPGAVVTLSQSCTDGAKYV